MNEDKILDKSANDPQNLLANIITATLSNAKNDESLSIFAKGLIQIMQAMGVNLTMAIYNDIGRYIEFIVKTEDDVRMLENCFKKVTSTIKLTVTIDDLVLQ